MCFFSFFFADDCLYAPYVVKENNSLRVLKSSPKPLSLQKGNVTFSNFLETDSFANKTSLDRFFCLILVLISLGNLKKTHLT